MHHVARKSSFFRRSYLHKPNVKRGYYVGYDERMHKTLRVDMEDGTYWKGHLTSERVIKIKCEDVEKEIVNEPCDFFARDGKPAYIVEKYIKQESKSVFVTGVENSDKQKPVVVECKKVLDKALAIIEVKANSKAVVSEREIGKAFIKRIKD